MIEPTNSFDVASAFALAVTYITSGIGLTAMGITAGLGLLAYKRWGKKGISGA
jgi:hypothetical protein